MSAAAGAAGPGRLVRYRAFLFAGRSTERTVFFSDAVFAIAMTLLVLEVQVPEVPAEELVGAIAEEWPSIFAYVLSFGAIALTWSNHHTVWKCIGRYTLRLQWINLLCCCWSRSCRCPPGCSPATGATPRSRPSSTR